MEIHWSLDIFTVTTDIHCIFIGMDFKRSFSPRLVSLGRKHVKSTLRSSRSLSYCRLMEDRQQENKLYTHSYYTSLTSVSS